MTKRLPPKRILRRSRLSGPSKRPSSPQPANVRLPYRDRTAVAKEPLTFPTRKKVGCVIAARNEGETLRLQLDELARLPFHEIIVVLNGNTDDSYQIVESHWANAQIVSYKEPLGHDVGRAVGARASSADIMLFLDGDMCIPAEHLLPFVYEAERGADVVLNPLSKLVPDFKQCDSVSRAKDFLNRCLGRPDLQIDSLTAVPHALSRKAIKLLGAKALIVPPMAQMLAIRSGLTIARASIAVDVFQRNRVRKHNQTPVNRMEQLILGDHLEALGEAMKVAGPRLGFPDWTGNDAK
jgi:hypothetical protein